MASEIDIIKGAERFKNSSFYKRGLKPFLEKQIERYRNIKEVTGDDLIACLNKNKGMLDAYQSVLNKIESWDKIKIVDEKGGEKNG